MLTDTHCHLADPAFRHDLPDILQTARHAGVSGIIVPSAAPADWQAVLDGQKQPMIRAAAVGIHPWYLHTQYAGCFDDLAHLLAQHSRAWVGEIGLDFHEKSPFAAQREQQIQCFETQLDLAQQFRRPVILHSLKATDAIVQSLRRTGFAQGGIAHAFSGSPEEAQRLIRHGFLIGLGNLLLQPAAKKVRRLAGSLHINHIVLETDSPFGLKAQRNTPANLLPIAQEVARIRQIPLPELALACEHNLQRLLHRGESGVNPP